MIKKQSSKYVKNLYKNRETVKEDALPCKTTYLDIALGKLHDYVENDDCNEPKGKIPPKYVNSGVSRNHRNNKRSLSRSESVMTPTPIPYKSKCTLPKNELPKDHKVDRPKHYQTTKPGKIQSGVRYK